MSKEIELCILSSGELRFSRSDKRSNEGLMDIIKDVSPEKLGYLSEFFDEANKIDIILGEELFCG